jgi:hypothetical protein
MFKQLSKWAAGVAIAISLISPLVVLQPVHAAAGVGDLWGGSETNQGNNIKEKAGLTATDPRIIMANVIKIFLGFLGIIAVMLILLAGFKYMTASGDEGETEKALSSIKTAVIGLIIILGAYALANFILTSALSVTSQ